MVEVKRVLGVIIILALLIGSIAPFLVNSWPAAAQDEKFQLAPLNPEFLDFLEHPPESSCGYVPPTMDLSHLKEIPVQRERALLAQQPSIWDWRDTGKVTPVKNQNPCGTCWIHGTLAAVESRVWIVDGVEYNFSEQNVACCLDLCWVYFHGNRCDRGGDSFKATDVLSKKGTRLESCDPYNTGTINTEACNDACTTIKRITGYRLVANSASQITEVKNAVYNYGPVSMAYRHDDAYFYPVSNIYYWPDCAEGANHLVCIVGWDDTVEWPGGASNGAWIVKNSWGTGFGDAGYFYLCYGSANMGEVASYRHEDYDINETVYYWDEAGIKTSVGTGASSTLWGASVFTSGQDGDLTHVDFWAVSNNAEYELYVYDGSFGSQLASKTGSCTEFGYYSIPLTTPVPLTNGQQFTVAVKMTTPGFDYPIPVEYVETDICEPPIQAGVSFLSTDGSTWADAAGVDGGCNVCLRAKITTESELNTPPEVTSVTASQSSPIVDITYDVTDAEQSEVSIGFEYWDGAGWQACITTTGEGTQTTGTGKSGTWDAKTDFDEHYMTDCKIKVTADDGQAENNIDSGESSAFTLDTKDPTGHGCSTPTNEITGVLINPDLTCLTASDDSLPISYYFQLAENDTFTQGLQESGWQTGTTWSPSTLDYNKQYFWRVKAKDSYGNETDYGSTFNFTTELATYDLSLVSGWNLISLPLIPENQQIDVITSSLGTNLKKVYYYDSDIGGYLIYNPQMPFPAGSDLHTMEEGKGYWFLVDNPCTFTIQGTRPSYPYTIFLSGGWNSIGLPLIPENQQINEITSSLGTNLKKVYYYDSDIGGYLIYNPQMPFPAGSDLHTMEEGKGYWFLVDNPCTFTIESPQ